MNRRSFIKSLTTVAAASIFLPRAADAFTWKQSPGGVYVVNPEYVNAPFEVWYWFDDKYLPLPPGVLPVRFAYPNDKYPVPMFIRQST